MRSASPRSIREKLTLELNEEVPYGIAVEIESVGEDDGQLVVSAVIWVDRAGQKPIVIGAGGERLKRIGTHARRELNQLLGPKAAPDPVGQGARGLGRQRAGAAPAGHGIERMLRQRISGVPCAAPARLADTGRIFELLTREHGRISVFAQGVRGPRARLAGVMQPFAPLLVSWAGRGESPRLTGRGSRTRAGVRCAQLPPARLMSALYLSELRDETHRAPRPAAAIFRPL